VCVAPDFTETEEVCSESESIYEHVERLGPKSQIASKPTTQYCLVARFLLHCMDRGKRFETRLPVVVMITWLMYTRKYFNMRIQIQSHMLVTS